MFPTLQTVVRSSFSRDDGLHSSGCSPPLLSAKSTATINRTLSDLTAAFSTNQVFDTVRRGGAHLFELLHSKGASEMTSQDHSNPFGYEFHENFPDSATGVAPPSSTEPLLNLQEHNFLANFWNNPSHLTNTNDLNSTLGHLNSANDASNYNWQLLMNEPPPTVRDIGAASVSQAPVAQQHGHGLSPHMTLSENPLNLHTNGMVDASALLGQSQPSQNSMRHMSNGSSISPAFQIPRNQSQSVQPQRVYQQPGLLNGSAAVTQASIMPGSLKMEPVHTNDALIGITSSTEMDNLHAVAHSGMLSALPPIQTANIPAMTFSSVPQSAPVTDRMDQSANPRLYHFGSDNNFNAGGFQPSSDFERHEYRAELLSSELRRLKPINRTPVGTREHSPEPNGTLKRQSAIIHEITNGKTTNGVENGHKRKRSHDSGATESEDDDNNQSTPLKKQRRSSGPAATRPKRENLSEVQKRQNHIASEQKRRAQIKLGFDELNRLVPEIRDSGLSKSGMLMEACNFLEMLKTQNTKLSQRLNTPLTTTE